MIWIILLAVPLILGAIGAALATDDKKSNQVIGFTIVAIAAIGIIIQIGMQVVDPIYYLR